VERLRASAPRLEIVLGDDEVGGGDVAGSGSAPGGAANAATKATGAPPR